MARTRWYFRHRSPRPSLEALEDRTLLSYTNVLVNSTAADTGSNDTQSETSLVLAGSTVVVGFNDSGSNASNNQFTGVGRSTDGGSSFTDGGTLPTSTAGDAGDPSLARDNVSGKIYFATLGYSSGNVIQVFRSTDGGATWAAPVNGAPGVSSGHTLDKEWITVDNATGSGQGNVYLVYTNFGGLFGSTDYGIYLTRSTDGGDTWSTPLSLGGSQGGYVTVGPDHSVYVFYFSSGSSDKILMRKSTDQGVTFGSAVTVATLTTTGTNGDLGLTVSGTNSSAIRTNAFPQAAVTANGIYVTFNDQGSAAGDKADVFFAKSTDGGATWTTTKLNDDSTTRDQWQPALAVTPDGNHVGVFWYDRRGDANDGLIDRYGVIGDVSGSAVTFGSNFRITDAAFPAVVGQDSLINSTYMGDYDVAVADNGAFYLTWGDNRLSDSAHAHQPDVRFAKVPLAGTTHFGVTASPSSTTAGSAFSVTVTALDANNNTDATYRGTVHFTTSDKGSGVVLPADYTFTAADNGVHTFTSGVTLVTAGSQTVTATDAANGSVNGSATETVTPGAATHLAVGAPLDATAGSPFTVTVTAQDAYNNTATGYRGTVGFTSSDPTASLPGSYTFLAGDAGTHAFTNGVTLNTTGAQTITVTDGVTATITGTATVNVSQLIQATKFVLTPSTTTTTAGSAFSVTVTAQDNNGNTANGYRGTVHFTSTDTRSGVVLPADYTFTAADNGVHAFTNGVTLVTAGGQTVTATDTASASITGGTTVTVNPGAATHFSITAPGSARVNVAFTITVNALDAYDNTATGYRGTVHFTSSLRKTRLPPNYTFTASDAGVHTFTNGVTFTRTGTAKLTAADTANGSIKGSVTISVTTSPLAGPGSPLDADAGLGEVLGEILDGNPRLDRDAGLRIGIVLQELRDEGILDALFASRKGRGRGELIGLLRDEIQTYLDGDVSFGAFHWL
jgi:hypothetical protein